MKTMTLDYILPQWIAKQEIIMHVSETTYHESKWYWKVLKPEYKWKVKQRTKYNDSKWNNSKSMSTKNKCW